MGTTRDAPVAAWKVALKWSLPVVLPLLFALGTWSLDRASIAVAPDAYRSPATVAANALPGLLACLALFVVTRRLLLSFLLGFVAQALVYEASRIKLATLESPVALEDVYFLTGIDSGGVRLFWAYVENPAAFWAVLAGCLLVVAVVAWCEKPWFRHVGPGRLALLAILLGATATLSAAQWPWPRLYPGETATPTRFTTIPAVLHSGLMTNLVDKHPNTVTMQEVDAWLFEPGIPANAPVVESGKFSTVNAARIAWQGSKTLPNPVITDEWTTQEWVHFLEGMPDTLAPEQLAQLDAAYKFTGTPNGEIAMRWYPLAERSGYAAARPELGKFVERVGRRKLIMPVYKALVATPEGLAFAEQAFARARPGYHPITTGSVEGVIAEAKGKAASTAEPFAPAAPGTPAANGTPATNGTPAARGAPAAATETIEVPQELYPVDPAPKAADTK